MMPITKELKEWAIRNTECTIEAYESMIEDQDFGDFDVEGVFADLPKHKEFLDFLESIEVSDG